MIRSTVSKVVWLGRATVFLVGLAVILALTVGAVSRATAHTGSAGLFHLGHSNAARALSGLVGTVSGGMLQVTNNSTAATATGVGVTNKSSASPAVKATNAGGGPALGLNVASGKAPMTVSAGADKVANLDADKVDGKSSEQFANAAHAHSGADVTSGTVAEARIDGSIARDSEVGTAVSGKADTTHQHSGADISSGTVAELRIDPSLARDGEVMPTVKANDGAGSGLDADQLDGQNSSFYLPGGNLPSGSTVRGAFAEADNAQAAGYSQYVMLSFGYSISFTPTLHYVASGAPTPTGCTGNVANPGAQPGHLCIFESTSFNVTNSRNVFLIGNSGAAVPLSSASANTFYAIGTWALTAP